MRQRTSLFDHLVCELQEELGDAEPKRFCGLEVDDKLKPDWRLTWPTFTLADNRVPFATASLQTAWATLSEE
jgi:hypothetical protein